MAFPIKHLSIRVPWHDHGWDGSVCQCPQQNSGCLVLTNVRENRDDELELSLAGQPIEELAQEEWPPCVGERGTFMAPFALQRLVSHPYCNYSEKHKNLKPTPILHDPYSAAVVPFRWMMGDQAGQIAQEYELQFNTELEPTREQLGFSTIWLQNVNNQKALLDSFFGMVKPELSLCFFYAKQVPFAETPGRILIGAGKVLSIGNGIEYERLSKDGMRSMIWERSVRHSIRTDSQNGFLMPYAEVFGSEQSCIDAGHADCIAFAPEDRQDQFSYAGEHVTTDTAIRALVAMATALRASEGFLEKPVAPQLKWIDEQLSALWSLRGPCPGLGPALCAFGIQQGTLLAYEISAQLAENEDPWPLINQVMVSPEKYLPPRLAKEVTRSLSSKWQKLPPERLALLKLMSRFELNADQATRFYVSEERADSGIQCLDNELLKNPYLLYELDRFSMDPIAVHTIDQGAFPAKIVAQKHPLPKPSFIQGGTDERRVRALLVNLLEEAKTAGNTLLAESQMILSLRKALLAEVCPVDADLIRAIESSFAPVIRACSMKNGEHAYQLDYLSNMGKSIRDCVDKRIAGRRHQLAYDWRAALALALPDVSPHKDVSEEKAREEKSRALQELAESRFSVLIGPAGTGKTTVLSVLASQPNIAAGQVLLLAPTGKARVRMSQATNMKAYTIAQFLRKNQRYDEKTGRYLLAPAAMKQDGYKTVIVDEASMLTEEQLGALIDAFKGLDRLILVGDPNQLPPIGSGRPFVDIVERLKPENAEQLFPRVGSGYAELPLRRRQIGSDREDLDLAEWYSGRPLSVASDEIWEKILIEKNQPHVRFVQWDTPQEISSTVIDILLKELKIPDAGDRNKFEMTLGAIAGDKKERVYFRPGAGKSAEDWQILSPVRGMAHGVTELNRMIQKAFRQDAIDFARRDTWIPKPLGPEEIIYGDKVINVRNHSRKSFPDAGVNYVANGEIGIAVGQFKKNRYEKRPYYMNVEFSSQAGQTYGYSSRDFGEEGSPVLELAYALTIHKSQGSEFSITFLVLPNPCLLLSRELLYTALTRHREKMIILHQGSLLDMKKYADGHFSETAKRLTNLFEAPQIVQVKERFLEDRLIHRTMKGEAVRSKSEVIVANMLAAKGIEYSYEKPFVGNDGAARFPDFTIVDDNTGEIFLWEHCGMMNDPGYKTKWEAKQAWYLRQGVVEHTNGRGQTATLIVTYDDADGGIDSHHVAELIDQLMG